MAKKYRQDKSKAKGILTAVATACAAAVVFTSIFTPHGFLAHLITIGLITASGFLGYTVGSGLDTTQEAPKSRPAVKKTGNPQVDMIIEKGNELLLEIRRENERIPDPKLTRQIDELESVTGKIFKAVEEQPQKAPQLRRFLEYYLPTTLNMLKNYRRIEDQKLNSDEAKQMLAKIENSMDVVLEAFKKQLDMLYRDDFIDLSADIKVFETILKQDNLIDENVSLDNADKTTKDTHSYTQQTSSGAGNNFGAASSGFAGAQAKQKKED